MRNVLKARPIISHPVSFVQVPDCPMSGLTDPSLLGRVRLSAPRVLSTIVERVAFWIVVGMPLLYLPLLATGLESPTAARLFAVLLLVNLVALGISRLW